jgi:restriction system protein
MKILVNFIVGLGCLAAITWGILFVASLLFANNKQQPRHQDKQSAEEDSTVPVVKPQARKVLDKLPSVNTRLPLNKHQQNIQQANHMLEQLRLQRLTLTFPKAIAILRGMSPYAFEELLLTCFEEQGWKIQRNLRYSHDGGVDGRVLIGGKLYLIQAKRYRQYIDPYHIHQFYRVIQQEKAAGGFFVHTGKTRALSKELLQNYKITLVSGQKLIDLVLGQQLKVIVPARLI